MGHRDGCRGAVGPVAGWTTSGPQWRPMGPSSARGYDISPTTGTVAAKPSIDGATPLSGCGTIEGIGDSDREGDGQPLVAAIEMGICWLMG